MVGATQERQLTRLFLSRSSEGSQLAWPVRAGIALLWIAIVVALSVEDPGVRLFLVVVFSAMAVGGTLVALVATWRGWRPGLAVEGISLFLATVGLSLIGFVPLLMLAILVAALAAAFFARWGQRRTSEETADERHS